MLLVRMELWYLLNAAINIPQTPLRFPKLILAQTVSELMNESRWCQVAEKSHRFRTLGTC